MPSKSVFLLIAEALGKRIPAFFPPAVSDRVLVMGWEEKVPGPLRPREPRSPDLLLEPKIEHGHEERDPQASQKTRTPPRLGVALGND